jgi:isoleucyl-tRNA synthetase
VLQNFCVTDLSALYFDVTKDILYTAPKNALERRAVQTVLYELLFTLTPMLVPVMPHMAEDIWLNSQKPKDAPTSILQMPWPSGVDQYLNPVLEANFKELLRIKDAVNIALEIPRTGGLIGSSLEAAIVIETHSEESAELLAHISISELATLFVVSSVALVNTVPKEIIGQAEGPLGSAMTIYAVKASGKKCVRCWKYLDSVGQNTQHTELCDTCVEAVSIAE